MSNGHHGPICTIEAMNFREAHAKLPVLDLCLCILPDSDLLFNRALPLPRDSKDPLFVAADAAAWTSLCNESISSLIPINPACFTHAEQARFSVHMWDQAKCTVPALTKSDQFHQQWHYRGYLENS